MASKQSLRSEQKNKTIETNNQSYEIYLSERKSLLEAKLKTAQDFDKYILTLSGGALGSLLLLLNK